MEGPVVSNGLIHGVCPVDLRPLPAVRANAPEEVPAAVARAREAQPGWEALGFDRRLKLLRTACKAMLARRQECLELLHDEIGKRPAEALLSEAVGPLQYVSDWARVARAGLRPRKLAISPLAFPGKRGVIERVPRGVIGVIAPWNFPMGNFFKPYFPALLCGNTVVAKPSEYAPRSAEWFAARLNEQLPPGVLTLVQGGGEIGQALVRSGIDAVTFTGSFRSGREVARLAGECMIPCSAELGGKDAAIVLSDCDLDRTVAGILYWALHNGGQACGAIERVFVEEGIADRFVDRLAKAVGALDASDVGPCANPAQLAVVQEHVRDAVAGGARILAGGKSAGKGLAFEPTLLDRCGMTMIAMREPTFGPVICAVRVKDADEAVRLANECEYGLNASVWSRDLSRAATIARRLRVGTAYVNNHAFTGAMPSAPWTGVGKSGYGIANSDFALQHYTRPRTLVVDRKRSADAWWFPMDRSAEELGHRLAEAQLGRVFSAIRIPFLISRRQKAALELVRTGRRAPERNLAVPGRPSSARRFGRAVKKIARKLAPPLTPFELVWGSAAIESVFSGTGKDQLELLPRDEARTFIKDLYRSMPFPGNIAMRAIFWMIGLSPVYKLRRLTTIDRLPPDKRLGVLRGFAKSESYLMRQAAMLLKMSGSLAHTSTTRFHQVLAERAKGEA